MQSYGFWYGVLDVTAEWGLCWVGLGGAKAGQGRAGRGCRSC